MQFIAAGFELDIHVRTGVTAVFSRVVSALNLEFLDSVQGGEDRDKGPTVRCCRDAVEAELHGCVPGAVRLQDAELRRCGHRYTRRKRGQVEEPASVQGEVDDALP